MGGGLVLGMFGSKLVLDEQLGELRRSGRYWKGSLDVIPFGTFPLALAGSNEGPNPRALALARELPERFSSMMQTIQTALFEHYAPYKEAVDAGLITESSFPNVLRPEEVWFYLTPAHVLIEPLEGMPTVEVAFRVAWDIEHTVAARFFQNWQFIELNGSVRRI